MPSATYARRAAAWQRRRYRRAWGPGISTEPLPVTFPTSVLTTRVYIALGADLTASYLTWNWLDITDRCRHDLGISLTVGRGDERGQVTPSRCTIKIDNNDGAFCRLNAFSPYYGLLTKNTPIWIQLDPGSGYVDRYFGYINEWPTTWADEAGTDAFTTIQCSGVMRRLVQGQVLRSPMFRTFSGVAPNDFVPHAYWPMEDGTNSTRFASAIPGHPPMTVLGDVSFASDSTVAGSDPLPQFSAGASAFVSVPSYVDTGNWAAMFVAVIDSEPAAETVYVEYTTTGTAQTVRISIEPGSPSTVWIKAYDASGTLLGGTGKLLSGGFDWRPTEDEFYGHPIIYAIQATFGAITFSISAGDEFSSSGPVVDGGVVTSIRTLGGEGAAIGHHVVFIDPLFSIDLAGGGADSNAASMFAWDGELAHERIARLCREERIPVRVQAATSAAMGPQGSGTLLSELRACELADQGVLFEYQFGLAYQALSERYDQPVAFSLDFDSGHIAGVPQPTDDDQRLLNKFTASRPSGSSATAEKTTGTLGTGAGGSGVYASSATVSVEIDNQLAAYAGWRVWLGTVDEVRWPSLGLKLHGTPELIPGWLSTPLGARINVANPVSPMPSETIDAVLEGYSERWDEVSWVAVMNTAPASPYAVGVAGDETTGGSWAQTGEDTQLAAELAEGGTSASVSIDGPLFSTDASDLAYSPLSLVMGGEVVLVSAISGGSSPQTFTVTRTLAKTHPAGTAVQVYRPLIAAY